MADVTVKLPTIDALIKLMTESGALSTLLVGTASAVQTRVKKNWLNSTGADGTQFKKGNADYLASKGASGRNAVIDMYYTGKMAKTFKVQRANDKEAALGFGGDQLPKARSNYNRRPNMLSTDSADLQDFATNVFNKLFKKAGKL